MVVFDALYNDNERIFFCGSAQRCITGLTRFRDAMILIATSEIIRKRFSDKTLAASKFPKL